MKTAGMVNGTPGWQLDQMFDAESEKLWEGKTSDEEYLAVSRMSEALTELRKAQSKVLTAAAYVSGTPHEAKLLSIFNGLEDLDEEITRLKEGIA